VEEIARDCRERLAACKRPGRITALDDLPKTATGKIRRNVLKNSPSERGASGGTSKATQNGASRKSGKEEIALDLSQSARSAKLGSQLSDFMAVHIYPNERRFYQEAERLGPWAVLPVVEELKPLARAAGLWNLFLPASEPGGLGNLDYAPLCEIMGRSHLAPEIFNCSAPDTGNMETILRFGDGAQKERWLKPLLAGEIRSAFAMTEPDVASSDATNVESSILRDGADYVINGRKWYTTGATDPRCKIIIFMGQTDPTGADRHARQSMILVPKDTPGVRVVRSLPVLGFYGVPDRASEVVFENVRVPIGNILLGEGRGFEIAQGRLGPGRIHHCMRLIGLSERVLERMCRRAENRVAFGRPLSEQTVTLERLAEARIMIEQARLLTLKAAHMMDNVGNKAARQEIAMIKVVAPNMAQKIVDWAIQVFGGGGTSNDHFLAAALATTRLLRLADGPDEVHRNQIGRLEIRRHQNTDPARTGGGGDQLSREEAEAWSQGGLWPRPDSLTP
jgi:acyl-CoA dehydrogenase